MGQHYIKCLISKITNKLTLLEKEKNSNEGYKLRKNMVKIISNKKELHFLNSMNIQTEDIISVIITLSLLAIWFLTLIIFNYPLISVSILWIGMITLSLVYHYVYKKKNRDMRIFKIRFMVSALPIYPILAYYVYSLIVGDGLPHQLRLIPFFIIFAMLFLNASVMYYFDKKNC